MSFLDLPSTPLGRVLLLTALLLPWNPAAALGFDVRIGDIEGALWSAEGVELEVSLSGANRTALRLTAARMVLPEPVGELRDIEIHCPQARLGGASIDCPQGTGHVHHPLLDSRPFPLSFAYDPGEGLSFAYEKLGFAGGQVDGRAQWTASGWRATLDGRQLQLQRLAALTGKFIETDLAAGGPLTFDAELNGDGQGLRTIRGTASSAALDFSNPASTRVGQGLAAVLRFDTRRTDDVWRLEAELQLDQGEIYLQPWYIAVADRPLNLDATAQWATQTNTLTVDSLHFEQPGVTRFAASAHLPLDAGIEAAAFEIDIIHA
ncbi:MAG: hypothetical protein ACREIV_15045, partial [Planctomycetaceae bacterium]